MIIEAIWDKAKLYWSNLENVFGNADIVDNADIVGCWLLKQSGTRLSFIESILKTPINHLIT